MRFVYNQSGLRIVFDVGSFAKLREEVERIGCRNAFILTTPGRNRLARQATEQLGSSAVGTYEKAVMHVPKETAFEACTEAVRHKADCIVAIGGGSTIGLAKAISLKTILPCVAVPTTYSGSEMTTIYGLTEDGLKRTGRDPRVLPKTTIYDPQLTIEVPPKVAGPSGINAIAHCVEALYAANANPITCLIAEEGLRALAKSLPTVVREPKNIEARSAALYGACLAGSALGAVEMALHHKLCHTLGGSFNLPHAETHAVILPHAVKYNLEYATEAMARISRVLNVSNPALGLFRLAAEVGAPLSLKSLGFQEKDLKRAADLAVENPYSNPRPINHSEIRKLLENAYYGRLN